MQCMPIADSPIHPRFNPTYSTRTSRTPPWTTHIPEIPIADQPHANQNFICIYHSLPLPIAHATEIDPEHFDEGSGQYPDQRGSGGNRHEIALIIDLTNTHHDYNYYGSRAYNLKDDQPDMMVKP